MNFLFGIAFLAVFAAGVPSQAAAQQWAPFVSQEGDFRVMFPGRPVRSVTREGSVRYAAQAGGSEFVVMRHDPRRLADVRSPKEDAAQRASIHEDMALVLDEAEDFGRHGFVIRFRGRDSVHHTYTEAGQYYEAVVIPVEDGAVVNAHIARDFFTSLQVARGGVYALPVQLPTPESCAARPSAFARTLCQYVSCLPPANASHPACAGVPRFSR